MRKLWIALAGLFCLYGAGTALADLTYTQGVGTTLFDFACFTTKHCPVHVNITSAGTENFTTAVPGMVDASTASQLHADLTAAIPAQANHTTNIGAVDSISQYPGGAIPLTASATGTTGATTATLAASAGGLKTYICWYSIRANATGAVTVTNTITGPVTGTLSSLMWVAPLASGIGIDEMIFTPCIPSSAANTAIAVVSGAPGTGGNVTVKAGGYQL
jgi:hypothetical protein